MNNPKIEKKPTRDVKHRRIMIVDDDSDQRVMIQMMLKNEGYETMLAENGSQFLEKIDKFDPDLVILDVMMPGLTTEEILEKLSSKKSKPKIILLTVVRYSEEALAEILKKGNIVAYIKKPFDLDDFINAINELI
ncbi:response regulator [Patescibacteria group bacterium]|nr:response regulator [Patescibacteria group bacterium]